MRRQQRASKLNNARLEVTKDVMVRFNTATLYGIYFANSNTDFLLKEKKTRFSIRPSVIVNADRQTVIFDYSAVKGTDEGAIFDGFFRGISAGATVDLGGGIATTCTFINEIIGVPSTDFADTYTIIKTDVEKKIIIATKATSITSTTAVAFDGTFFIDLPQFTKITNNETSSSVRKILNLLPSQSLSHLGVGVGSVLEFKKTASNNDRFTVKSIYTENGIEVVEVEEPITQEDVTQTQIIMSVYGEAQKNSATSNKLPAQALYTTALVLSGCEAPVGLPRPPGFTGDFKKWLNDDLECCKCLVYAEGECNNDQCQKCTAWTIWNRRRDRVPGGAVPPYNGRDEDSYCDQATMRGRFEGGWGNAKFNSCFCDNTTNPQSLECERKADLICKQIGNSNYLGLPDPTGGANYFWTDGSVPDYMDCNVQSGNCRKVTGVCASCGNAFYICKRVPQPCSVLGLEPRIIVEGDDDTPPVQSG